MVNSASTRGIVTDGDLAANVASFARHLRAANLTPATQRAYLTGLDLLARFLANAVMDVGHTNGWRLDDVVPAAEIVGRIDAEFPLEPIAPAYRGEVARRYRDGAGEIGLIASVSQRSVATAPAPDYRPMVCCTPVSSPRPDITCAACCAPVPPIASLTHQSPASGAGGEIATRSSDLSPPPICRKSK